MIFVKCFHLGYFSLRYSHAISALVWQYGWRVLNLRVDQIIQRHLKMALSWILGCPSRCSLDLEKAEEPENQIASSHWIIEKAREFQKNICFCFVDYAKAFDCVGHKKLWIILQEMGIPDHLTCLLRNQYASQEATVRTWHKTTDWFQIGKGVCQGCILSPAYLTYMQSTSWETLGWKKHKLESRCLGDISITSDIQMTPSIWQKGREAKKPLVEGERGEWKSWLKIQHSKN